jgi:fibronectin type 3 domain-containing protein
MVRKLSRDCETRQDTDEMVSQRRQRVLIAPGTALLLAFLLMFQFVGSVHAQSVTLAWDPNVDTVLGYKVYRSEQPGSFSPPSVSSLLGTTSYGDATVQPGHTYYYVVTEVSTSGVESGYSNEVQAVIPVVPALVTNKAPTVNAGADQTITLPATATLTATASDDGLPNGALTYQWGIVSGSGVSLSATNTASVKATFTAAGTYTFRVTVSDGQLSASDDVIVVVNAALITNKAPAVNAGADQTITLPATATLTATASDDGLPNNTLTYQWSVLSGSGVTLSATNTASTKATFTAAGTYTFRVTVSDGQLSASDDVIVVVTAATTNNKAPTVNAGADQTIMLPATATLTATASDDGLPNSTLTYQWTVVSGIGVTMTNPSQASVQVSFAGAGTFTFRVTVNDGQLSASDDVAVVVSAATSDLTITISKNGNTINGGAITPVYVQAPSTQVQKLELLIDGQIQATTTGTSLSFRWKTNKVSRGSHTVKANAYVGQVIVATKTLTVDLL